MNDRWDDVRHRLDGAMRDKKINKAELSRAINRSPGFIHDFLTGKQMALTDGTIKEIAKILNVDVLWLMALDPIPKTIPLTAYEIEELRAVTKEWARKLDEHFSKLKSMQEMGGL